MAYNRKSKSLNQCGTCGKDTGAGMVSMRKIKFAGNQITLLECMACRNERDPIIIDHPGIIGMSPPNPRLARLYAETFGDPRNN